MQKRILSFIFLNILLKINLAQNQPYFDLEAFKGRWYEISHDEDHPYIRDGAVDVTLDIESQPGAEFRMTLRYLDDERLRIDEKYGFWENPERRNGVFELKEIKRESNDIVKFFKRYNSEEVEVVETDYTNYAVLFYKRDKYLFFDDDWGQILSRTPSMDPQLLERLIRILEDRDDVERDEWIYPRQSSTLPQ